jgi:enediyne biosynthesis protein E4
MTGLCAVNKPLPFLGGRPGIRALFATLAAFAIVYGAPAHAEEAPQKPLGDIPIMHEEAAAAGLNNVYDGP